MDLQSVIDAYLERCLTNGEMASVDGMASELECSRRKIHRLFKAYFGITPRAYLRSWRCRIAMALGERGPAGREIAARLGYSNVENLLRFLRHQDRSEIGMSQIDRFHSARIDRKLESTIQVAR